MEHYPEAYLRYLQDFHITRDYFECHETLEEYWKEHLDSPHRITWVGLIQVAVASYHQRRGNIRGALKMLTSAVKLLDPVHLSELGIEEKPFIDLLRNRIEQLRHQPQTPFMDLNIPVKDEGLLFYVSPIEGYEPDPYLLNKHTLRDRSDVITAREAELARRRITR